MLIKFIHLINEHLTYIIRRIKISAIFRVRRAPRQMQIWKKFGPYTNVILVDPKSNFFKIFFAELDCKNIFQKLLL